MRKWLITGVSSGLGRALAEAALNAGDVVAGTVRGHADAEAFAALQAARTHAFRLDVTDHDAVSACVGAAEAALGGIDLLVNNAGASLEGTLEETPWADLRAQFEVNFFGPIAVIKAALPRMRARRRGLIVNISSVAGFTPGGGTGAYGAAKAALDSVSKSLARECAPFGIGVMSVIPGAYRTRLGDHRRSAPDAIADYADQNAARRARLAAFSGHQRGDPRKAAAVIMEAAGAPRPPGRLVLGPDAVDAVLADCAAFAAEIEAWKSASRSTDV